MCFLGLLQGTAGGWRTAEMASICLEDFCWEVQMRKIGVTIERRIFLQILWNYPYVTA